MDALKKAEQEKREAAKRLEESRGPGMSGEVSSAGEAAAEHAPVEPAAPPVSVPRASTTLELELEPLGRSQRAAVEPRGSVTAPIEKLPTEEPAAAPEIPIPPSPP